MTRFRDGRIAKWFRCRIGDGEAKVELFLKWCYISMERKVTPPDKVSDYIWIDDVTIDPYLKYD